MFSSQVKDINIKKKYLEVSVKEESNKCAFDVFFPMSHLVLIYKYWRITLAYLKQAHLSLKNGQRKQK